MEAMANTHDPARAALTAFLRRVFCVLANEAQRDALAFRKVLETLR